MVFAFSLIYNGNGVTNGTGVLTLRNFLDSGANFEVDVYPHIIIPVLNILVDGVIPLSHIAAIL